MANKKHFSSQNPHFVQPKRLFKDNDEIILLNSLLEFRSKTGLDPMKILPEFYNRYKDKLSVKTKHKQFCDKIWKLKYKYVKYLKKESLIFPNNHGKKLFELSNKFWGEQNRADDKVNGAEDPRSFLCMDVLKRGMNLIGDSERREFDRRCMRLKVQEAKLRVQRAELLEEQVDLIYKGLLGSS